MLTQYNIEQGMPTVETAKRRLDMILARERVAKTIAIKIIHGYGSSGVGGRLRVELRKYLTQCSSSGKINYFITGEEFSIFSEKTRALLDRSSSVKKDPDMEKHNNGITVVVLR